jgi:hypothetical protein
MPFRIGLNTSALTLGFGLLTAMTVHSALVISTLQEEVAGKSPASRSQLTLDVDKIRMDMHGDKEITLIYRKDKNVFWMVDAPGKSYTEMTSQDLEQISSTLDAARLKMQEQLKDLPPEQKAMMEKMMGGLMTPPAQPKVTFKKALGTGKVGSWTCQNWESFLDGEKNADHCVADFKSVGVKAEDFLVFKEMAQFLGKLAPAYKGLIDQGMNFEAMGGLPVQTTTVQDGKADNRITMESIKRITTAEGRFDLPAGLTKKALPGF